MRISAEQIQQMNFTGDILRKEKVYPISIIPEEPMGPGDRTVVDFGNHFVGRVTLLLSSVGSHPDAPVLLRLKFCEHKKEIPRDSAEYEGWISRGWIQEEIRHVDELPVMIRVERRYAFRYLVCDVIDTSSKFRLVIENVYAEEETSADDGKLADFSGTPSEQAVARVSCRTLRGCMQEVFEDGPKRDRRLWLGDLRLQALANYATYKNNGLVRKCLYLFAAAADERGREPACLFTRPRLEGDDTFLFDYSLLYIAALRDYVRATGDTDTGRELWDTAFRQWELSRDYLENGIVKDCTDPAWCLIDWNMELNKQAAAQGVHLYAGSALLELGNMLFGCRKSVAVSAQDPDAAETKAPKKNPVLSDAEELAWRNMRKEISEGLRKEKNRAAETFFDQQEQAFVSGGNRQLSVMSQAWCVLGGMADAESGKRVLLKALSDKTFLRPVTPYAYHSLIEAMLLCGMRRKAYETMMWYWGGMLDDGADTFYELFDPEDPSASPYGSDIVNSYCHAWSCTPVYFMERFRLREGEL